MITVEQATAILDENLLPPAGISVPLAEATGRVLQEAVYADRDFPPYNRVAMDGIAIQFASYHQGEDTFEIEGIQLAGAKPLALKRVDNCLEVMTGAMLPQHTNTVIRYEDLKLVDRKGLRYAHIVEAPKAPYQNVHRQGSDRRAGELLIAAGTLLGPAEIAVAATVGKTSLQVSQPPQVAIISTGDELVEIAATPGAHQIRQSNAYMLQAALRSCQVAAERFHLADDPRQLKKELARLLETYEVLILSGGVSKGKADFVPQVLQQLGVEQLFHEVAQKPGKPFWFGRNTAGKVVFALPGNPNSTFLCYYRFVEPWLRKTLGAPPALRLQAILREDVTFRANLTYYLPVSVAVAASGMLQAKPIRHGGSGDLASLLEADGFLELPRHQAFFASGDIYQLYLFRRL
ncbi:MAG: molybdopterin molybdotransferase MoeA [Adhaeribacter sp.]